MDFALNEEQRSWQMKARKFAAEELKPYSLARDRIKEPLETWSWEIIKRGSALGFRTACVPKSWGGHGIDFVTQAIVMAELAKADSAMSKAFSQCWKWSHLIAKVCTEDQKKRFLTPFLEDDTYVLGKGMTEHNGGSDNRLPPNEDPKTGLRISGVREGDTWILNGEKAFIANGSVGKLFFLDVRTNPTAPLKEGVTLFLVPGDTPGFTRGKTFNKSGWRFYQNAELIFENARVPHANVIGEVNGAYKRTTGDNSGDLFGDLELAANALGVCDAACEQALELVRTRKQGGQAIKHQQLIELKINRMQILTEALRSYVMRVAWEHDAQVHTPNAGLVMNYSTDVIQEVSELNLDIHDAAGCELDEQADKLVRDSFIWSHLAGDTVQRLRPTRKIIK